MDILSLLVPLPPQTPLLPSSHSQEPILSHSYKEVPSQNQEPHGQTPSMVHEIPLLEPMDLSDHSLVLALSIHLSQEPIHSSIEKSTVQEMLLLSHVLSLSPQYPLLPSPLASVTPSISRVLNVSHSRNSTRIQMVQTGLLRITGERIRMSRHGQESRSHEEQYIPSDSSIIISQDLLQQMDSPSQLSRISMPYTLQETFSQEISLPIHSHDSLRLPQ